MTLTDILLTVKPVVGWLSDSQMTTMYPFVSSLPFGSIFVEIGTYHGRSTLFFRLTNPNIHIITVDPCKPYFANGHPVNPPAHIDDDILAHGNIFQVIGPSEDVEKTFAWKIDAMFIDGDYTYEGIMRDAAWLKHVKKDGIVIFHDYESSHQDVKKAVDALIEQKQIEMVTVGGTICVTKKL